MKRFKEKVVSILKNLYKIFMQSVFIAISDYIVNLWKEAGELQASAILKRARQFVAMCMFIVIPVLIFSFILAVGKGIFNILFLIIFTALCIILSLIKSKKG